MKLLKNIREYTHSKPKTKKLIGVAVIVIGFVGVLLPIVPGLWLIFFGLELLGLEILFFDKAVKFLRVSGKEITLVKIYEKK
jgi:uncharacterized protein YqgC (DUF456 family)